MTVPPLVRRWAPVVVGAAAAAWLLAFGSTMTAFGRVVLAAAGLMVFMDSLDLLLRYFLTASQSVPSNDRRRRKPRPYALVASAHDAEADLPLFFETMSFYKDVVWIIDDVSSDITATLLRANGFRCVQAEENLNKPGAIQSLLARLPQEVETVLIFDPDSFVHGGPAGRDELERIIAQMQAEGLTAVCPRIVVRAENWLTRFQSLEYALSVGLGRRALGDQGVCSGVSIYKRVALERALRQHSLSVYAEDLENSLLLLASGETIRVDERITVETEGKATVKDLMSQRVGWAFGHIRVCFGAWPLVLKVGRTGPLAFYQYLIYMSVLGILFQPFRLLGAGLILASFLTGLDTLMGWGLMPGAVAADPMIFAVLYAKYTLIVLFAMGTAVRSGERLRHVGAALLYMPYQLAMTIPTTLGFLNWLSLRWLGKRVANDHFDSTSRAAASAQPSPQLTLQGAG